MKTSAKNTFDIFGFSPLSKNEMMEVKGGIRPKPKSRDLDVFDEEENE